MHAHDDSQQRAELRLAFLKHLPVRVEALARRGRQFCREGWDINGLVLLFEDVQRLAGAAGTHGALDVSQQLLEVEIALAPHLEVQQLPDERVSDQLLSLFALVSPEAPVVAHTAPLPASNDALDSTRVELPPPQYWRRWSSDATPPVPIADPSAPAERAAGPDLGVTDEALARALAEPVKVEVAATAALLAESTRPASPPAPVAATPAAPAPRQAAPSAKAAAPAKVSARVYHLSGASALSIELDQRLETQGFELELLEDAEELKEVLAALAPDLVLVDAEFTAALEGIGAVLRSTRERTGARIQLLALCAEDSVPVRLAARRAGADALLFNPRDADEVINRMRALLEKGADDVFRVLIVEDDRSQALFAESILRNAGMEARVVLNAFEVLHAMADFHPDMVLMDLYMPECDGTELTALIREREEFLHTPIVFLSGESDVDKHYDALEAGGDDFLAKPIRPKHLIAAVSNRVRRARAVQRRGAERDPRDPATGLFQRAHVLDHLSALLASDDVRNRNGGMLFVDVDGLGALREKLGLSKLERLLADVGGDLVGRLGGEDIAARYSDGCYLVVSGNRDEASLEALALSLRSALASRAFDVDGRPVRLRLSIGVCALRHGFSDAGAMINTAERLSREARASERGIRTHAPPARADAARAERLANRIRQAIEGDDFELLYQPIVALQGGEESQFQTLLRLREDNGDLLPAAQFMPVAESHDLMADIDRWVLGRALQVIESRRREGAPVRLFVNQSIAGAIGATDHADWLIAQLRARGIDGSALVLELALDETELHLDAVQSFCRRLVPHGIGFCLSRFESGDTAELVLERLPAAYIKLGQRHVAANPDAASRDELHRLAERAHRQGVQVIAPRVEDAQAAATLWMSGIDFIQGNLVQQAARELSFDFQAAVL